MSSAPTTAGTDRLLHGSPERTTFVRIDEATGEQHACKVFVSGSMADAEHEMAMGRLCAGAGVVRYLRHDTDATTSRPCVITAFETGTDLDRLVANHGALSAARACELLAPIADALARMHALQTAEAPLGVCHGDVKPKNLLHTETTTLLLDFEHARPIDSTAASRRSTGEPFTGGTRAFAPPEAALGVRPDGAFDVYGLGATLRWLTSGGGAADLPQHPDFLALVAATCNPDPAQRPRAADIAGTLRSLAVQLAMDPDELLLDAAVRGMQTPTTYASPVNSARPGLLRLLHARTRLLQRLPRLLTIPAARPTEPAALLREITLTTRILGRFPRHRPAWIWRHELSLAAGRLLAEAPAQIAMLRRAEEFDSALQWLTETEELTRCVQLLPGGCPIAHEGGASTVGLLHRDPLAFLQQLRTQVSAARLELASETANIRAAESNLDLEGAERAIEAMAERYGGSSPTATRSRDQLHRLGFYLDRIARAQPNVERIGSLWDAVALRPLTDFITIAARSCQRKSRSDTPTGVVGLRSLQITFVNLGEEFPHLPQAAPALEALSHALAHLTDQGWQLLAEAEKCLHAVPVPVRPLQVALSRLDTYRILEAIVDRPGRPRSQLQDALESLRLRLDQARATRDRLAEGAEDAMARGHWTTGLFDMERAVADLNPTDESERAEAARLTARLAAAKRRKQEVEAAIRRNVELATRYGTMQDDPSSSFHERLEVLAARRDCLHLLTIHVAAERSVLYGRDLRDVETQIALEQAAGAEHELDSTIDPAERLRVAQQVVDQLMASVSRTKEPPGRVLRLLDHWRTVSSQCQKALDQVRLARHTARRQRRRLWSVAAGAALASAGVIILAVWPWLAGAPANASSLDRRAIDDELLARIDTLPLPLRSPATQLLATASEPATPALPFVASTWHIRWERDVRAYASAMTAADTPVGSRTFAIACWDRALTTALPRLDEDARRDLETRTRALADSLVTTRLRPTGF